LKRREDATVVVHAGRIAAVRPRREDDPEPLCRGCFVLPGLIDAHVHTPPRIVVGNQRLFALLYLAHGVTTVRDMGQSDGSVAGLAAALNAGELVGPHMLRCGPVLDGDPPGWPMAKVIRTAEEGTAIVARLAADGVDCIKVYNEIGPAAFDAIAAGARAHGLPLVGHVPHAVGLDHVRDFEAQHMTGVPYRTRPRPPQGWDIRTEDILAMSDAETEAAMDVARARDVSFTPTLANFGLRLVASDPVRFPPTPAAAFLPGYWAQAWNVIAGHPQGEAAIARQVAGAEPLRHLVARARAHGIDVLAGTDTLMPWVVPGESLLLEIDELARAFGDPEAALAAATTVDARHLAPGEIGVVAPGARADLLLLPVDPTRDLGALRAWRIVVADGRRYDRATVDAWLDRYRRHFHGRLHAGVMNAVVSRMAGRYGG